MVVDSESGDADILEESEDIELRFWIKENAMNECIEFAKVLEG